METIVLHILKLRYVVLASMRIKVLYKVQIYHGAYHADYYYMYVVIRIRFIIIFHYMIYGSTRIQNTALYLFLSHIISDSLCHFLTPSFSPPPSLYPLHSFFFFQSPYISPIFYSI